MNKKQSMTINEAFNAVEAKLKATQNKWRYYVPDGVDPDRTLALIMSMLRGNPDLMRACEHTTFWQALSQLMKLDLQVDGVLGEAYLMPFGNEVKLVIGYKGLITLAQRSGEVQSLYAACVYDSDDFSYSLGMHQDIKHVPAASSDRTAGELTHVYAICSLVNGTKIPLVLDRNSVENHKRQYAKGSNRASSPWQTSAEQMWLKTVIRKMLNSGMIPLSREVKESLNEDGTADLAPREEVIKNFVDNYTPDTEEVEV